MSAPRSPGSIRALRETGATSRVMKIATVAEATAAKRDIEKIVEAWCEWRDSEEW